MSSTARVRRPRRTVAAAAALGVVALCGSLALPAQAAFAAGAKAATLSVHAPATVGFAGQPVGYTTTITNTGTEAATYTLALKTTTDGGTPPDAITIGYKDPANGQWKTVALQYGQGPGRTVTYEGTVPGVTVQAGKAVKLDMRIGAPMGRPHNGATNGGFRSISLSSRLITPGSSDVAEQISTIGVASIRTSLAHVPATAVAGGDPVEFDAVLANPTPSAYVNLGNVLFTDSHATVQVRKADGTWTTLKKVSSADPDQKPGVYLQGRDSSIGAGKTTVTRVRVSYDRTTPLGATEINPCVFVNEGSPFRGTTHCVQGSTVKIVAPAKAPATTPAPTKAPAPASGAAAQTKPVAEVKPAAAPAAPVADASTAPAAPATGQLAATGAESSVVPATVAGVLATLGAGAVLLARRLRRQS
ncbi:hypothetical protein ACWEQL_15800 [Kitasatospora sp. NPDC004240]